MDVNPIHFGTVSELFAGPASWRETSSRSARFETWDAPFIPSWSLTGMVESIRIGMGEPNLDFDGQVM
jgi:hypothetical protein